MTQYLFYEPPGSTLTNSDFTRISRICVFCTYLKTNSYYFPTLRVEKEEEEK